MQKLKFDLVCLYNKISKILDRDMHKRKKQNFLFS